MRETFQGATWGLAAMVGLIGGSVRGESLDFNREVRPILAAKCFECHGPDEAARKGKLRLDEAGAEVFLNGEFVHRITTEDPDDVMPPPKSKKTLDFAQAEILRAWVEAGAEYEEHWAFVPPVRPEVPVVRDEGWVRNSIDAFVLARLEVEGLEPSREADLEVLVRRVYLDLTGLPPAPEEADAFIDAAIRRPDTAWEVLVDRLLASPHYGERWARAWMDLARYADTNGYEKDRERSIWPWRDWVIDALNDGMPFDQFTVEQLAGDMLPDATLSQRIATGFHRNTMLNEEGGIDPLEFRFHAMVDRVATTGTVWMGLTIGCAQCHTHKYDPVTHHDYFRFMALMNQADEPELIVEDAGWEARRAEQEAKIEQFEDVLLEEVEEEKFEAWLAGERERAVQWEVMTPVEATSNLPLLQVETDGAVFASGDFTKRDVYRLRFELPERDEAITALRLEVLPDLRLPAQGPGRSYYEGRSGDFFLSEFRMWSGEEAVSLRDASHSFGKISVGSGGAAAENVLDGDGSTGWSTATQEGRRNELVLNLVEPLVPGQSSLEVELLFERHFVAALGKFRLAMTMDAKPAVARPGEAADVFTAGREALRRDYVRYAPEFEDAQKTLAKMRAAHPAPVTTLVMEEFPPENRRTTYLHHRGEYLSTRDEVEPGIPEVFAPLARETPSNRLELARWLVSEANPLGARVAVNREWAAFFGQGIVKTVADFGMQAAPRTHPELLDWLACELVDGGWSIKDLHRHIVTSATYRQDSAMRPELRERDPENALLARGPRHRLEAEMVRDVALRASGLLSDKIGGASVYPPQPDGVVDLAYGNTKWVVSEGEDRYRRSLYTFAKRTAPFAAYTVFDAPTGESCIPQRDRSNTPLQALTLLNDPMFMEAVRAAAERVAGEPDAREAATRLFRQFVTRWPEADEVEDLVGFFEMQRARGTSPEEAWTLVARVLLNLDETITKP